MSLSARQDAHHVDTQLHKQHQTQLGMPSPAPAEEPEDPGWWAAVLDRHATLRLGEGRTHLQGGQLITRQRQALACPAAGVLAADGIGSRQANITRCNQLQGPAQ